MSRWWEFWKKQETEVGAFRRVTTGSSTSSAPPKPKTVEEQIKALTDRVAELEKDAQVFADQQGIFFIGDGGSTSYSSVYKSRPRVGEGVRLLMQHLGLTFEAGKTAPDRLAKAKKPKKK